MDALVKIFHDGYERSATWTTSGSRRQAAAAHWWEYFGGYVPPGPGPSGGAGAWFGVFNVLKKRRQNGIVYKKKGGVIR